jgi:hypothetical protein
VRWREKKKLRRSIKREFRSHEARRRIGRKEKKDKKE